MRLPLFYLPMVGLALFVACGGGSSSPQAATTLGDQGAAGPAPAASGELVLARTSFIHDGFRTEVRGTAAVEEPAALGGGDVQGARTLTVALRNLSSPTGDLSSRATINFGRQFDNFIVVPTSDGPMTLYLHRDGTLRSSPDDGGFT